MNYRDANASSSHNVVANDLALFLNLSGIDFVGLCKDDEEYPVQVSEHIDHHLVRVLNANFDIY